VRNAVTSLDNRCIAIEHVGPCVMVLDRVTVKFETLRREWDRRLQLPFVLEVAAERLSAGATLSPAP
jgi:hypothetical protein